MLEALDGRLNSPPRLRVLLLVFLGSAAVFSALPLLRYLRGHTIFDYELWYATGTRVLAGDETFSFAPLSMSACIRRHARSFWPAQVCSGKEGSFFFL
jgi:hypothetical protein